MSGEILGTSSHLNMSIQLKYTYHALQGNPQMIANQREQNSGTSPHLSVS